MPLVLSSAATAACSPSRNYNRSFHNDEDSISVASRGSASDWDHILCASPSSCAGTRNLKKIQESGSSHREKQHLARTRTEVPALLRCYDNADFSDRIGRTLSFLLLTRLAVSFLLASLLGEE